VIDTPETHYAKTPEGLNIAYQVVGDGPIDIVFVSYLAGIEVVWDEPVYARSMRRFADMGRLIMFESGGIGSSDPIPLGALPTPEVWMDDVRVVLDAVGSTAAHFVCHGFGGHVGIVLAATHPERTASLVLVDSYARAMRGEDYPIGYPPEVRAAIIDAATRDFGRGGMAPVLVPSRAGDEVLRRWFGRWERTAFSSAMAVASIEWVLDLDLRSVLPAINVPTLVMNHRNSVLFPVAFSEYLADNIAGARLRLLPGPDCYLLNENADEVIDEIEEFITGARPIYEPDRALATVLFTDIVSSTDHATSLGDNKWRRVLDQHDLVVRHELDLYRGKWVNSTGDGMLATFDGPARAVRCAQAIVEAVKPLGIEVRAGLHTGEVELRGDDIGGIAVHIGQRVSALAGPGEVLVSRTVTDLVAGSGLEFEERGEHELKGVPGKWAIYAVKA